MTKILFLNLINKNYITYKLNTFEKKDKIH